MEIYGYKRNFANTIATWLAILASGFLLRLVFFWKPHWFLYCTFDQCALKKAQKVLLKDKYQQYYVEQIKVLVLKRSSYARILFKAKQLQTSAFRSRRSSSVKNDELSLQFISNNVNDTSQVGLSDDEDVLRNSNINQENNADNNSNLHDSEQQSRAGHFPRRNQTYGSLMLRNSSELLFNQENQEPNNKQRHASNTQTVAITLTDAPNSEATSPFCDSTRANEDERIQRDDKRFLTSVDVSSSLSSASRKSSIKSVNDSDDNGSNYSDDTNTSIVYFDNKKLRYIWDESAQTFIRLYGLDQNIKISELKHMLKGLNQHEQNVRRLLFGENTIHIQVQSYLSILFEEVLGPFYIFQIFSVILWLNDNYGYYASCIIFMSLVSLISGVYQIRRNQQQLKNSVKSSDRVKVCRGRDKYVEIDSSQLVPGDIVVVPTFNTILQFDGLLLNGNVIVNESMLTGESVPVTKTPMQFETSKQSKQNILDQTSEYFASTLANNNEEVEHGIYYHEREHSKNTLFCGTKVIQTRFYGGAYVKALVLRTGFQTTKGELIRSIMFPKPVDFKFNSQTHKFIGVLACCAMIGFIYTVVLKSFRGESFKEIIIKALDLITITVPPALPAAMTIGIIYAESRLRTRKIYCISPRSINISGCINCVCFDKTGTLTEDDLSFNEVVPFDESAEEFGSPFDEEVMQSVIDGKIDCEQSKQLYIKHNLALKDGSYTPLMHCLATCHSLTKVDGKIIGDPLDLQMFEATGWILEEPDVDDENKFDLLAPTVVKPPKRKVRNAKYYQRRSNINDKNPIEYVTGDSLTSLIVDEYEEKDEQLISGTSSDEDLKSIASTTYPGQEVGVLRQFPFSSSLQRMSVVTRQLNGNQYIVYAKGAPEKIAQLCDPSTIPENFSSVLQDYTYKGFRVIALAYRPLKAGLSYAKMQRASRLAIEKDLRFLGFLTLGNLLKNETENVIQTLNKADIRTIMVTGDNMLTAISVANECGMIKPFDKTVLLEIESSNMESGEVYESGSPTRGKQVSYNKNGSLILNVDNIVDNTTNPRSNLEKEPILYTSPCQASTHVSSRDSAIGDVHINKIVRPKITWRYVEFAKDSKVNEQQSPTSDSVVLRLNENSRLHLALTGETWDVLKTYYPEIVDAVCVRGTVFARMSPNQKQQLVEQLQSLQYYVGMCGDGANDSGALRAAHAGISLSDTEASVAAPFTSANPNISCVPVLISEGRAALVTGFSILKYIALYSLTQFCSVLLLYTSFTNFSNFESMYEDLFIIAVITAFFGRTKAYPILAKKPPPSSLISLTQLTSCAFQLALVITFQTIACVLLWNQTWYEPRLQNNESDQNSHDNVAIFTMSAFQCATLAVVFSKGKPYKKSILSNYPLALSLLVIVVTTAIILLQPHDSPLSPFKVAGIPIQFKLILLSLAAIHFCLANFCERIIVDEWISSKGAKLLEIFGYGGNILLFEKIDRDTQSTHWLSSDFKQKIV